MTASINQDLPYIVGTWPHLFGPGAGTEAALRIVFDRVTRRIVALEIMHATGWRAASIDEIQDVYESFVHVNDVPSDPLEAGFSTTNALPLWAADSIGARNVNDGVQVRVCSRQYVKLLDLAQVTTELIEKAGRRRKDGLKSWEKKLLGLAQTALASAS